MTGAVTTGTSRADRLSKGGNVTESAHFSSNPNLHRPSKGDMQNPMPAKKLSLAKPYLAVAAAVLTVVPFHFASAQNRGFQFYGAPAPSDFSTNIGDAEIEDSTGPLDLGVFSRKPFKFTFSVREGFDSNVFTTRTDPQSSFYTNFAAGISYDFGSPRLQLRSSLGGGLTYYYNRGDDPIDWNGAFSLGATYLATPRLTLSIDTNTAYLSQPDLSIIGATDRVNGDYLYTNTSISAAYQWTEKFSTVTSYRFGATYYVENDLNDNQGRIEQTISQSGEWLILPKTTGILEYRINPVTYFEADLDSLGQFFLVGIEQQFNPRLNWNARVGAEMRFNNNPVDGQSVYIGPYMESNLEYQFGPASTIGWLMRYGTEASGINNVTQRQTFRTGVNVNHAFTKRLSANFSSNWLINYYDQADVIPEFYENIIDFSVGLNFAVNRFVSLSAGYSYTIDIAPDNIDREYNRSVAFVGANFGF
jgi:hypothetical protein